MQSSLGTRTRRKRIVSGSFNISYEVDLFLRAQISAVFETWLERISSFFIKIRGFINV